MRRTYVPKFRRICCFRLRGASDPSLKIKTVSSLKTLVDTNLSNHTASYTGSLNFNPFLISIKLNLIISTVGYSLLRFQRFLMSLEAQHCSSGCRNGVLRYLRCSCCPASIQLPIIFLLISVYPTHFPPMSTHENIAVRTHHVGLGSHFRKQLILHTQHLRRPLQASLRLVTKMASSDHYVISNHVVDIIYITL